MTIGDARFDEDILKTYFDQYNQDPSQFSWSNIFNAVKDFGGAAAKFATSGPGLATFGGGVLGLLDKAEPTGGGTAQAYQGPMDMTRTMVQGPYGPLAEYKSSFLSGAPDYRSFTGAAPAPGTAPTQPPTAPSRSIDSKIAEYRQLASYGLSNDRIRRIAETFHGPQTDTDWTELTRLAGGTVGGIKAPAPAGAPVAAPAAPKPTAPPLAGAATPPPRPTAGPAPNQFAEWVSKDLTPQEKAAAYNNYLSRGYKDEDVRRMAGTQSDSDWASLTELASGMPRDLVKTEGAPFKADIQQAVQKYNEAQPGYVAPTPAPSPPVAAPAVPEGSEGYRFAMQPGGIGEEKFYENIANFIRTNPTEEAARDEMQKYGISEADVYRAKLKYNLLNGSGFYEQNKPPGMAHGGAVQMEDGGFVMTKRAVDGAGGPQGIQQLVPGARMIRGPGHGTSDSIPAVINGRNGKTPARLSNGEAYVPPGRNTKGLYALMHQLERKA
jgi:hypothetical protein